MKAGWPRLQNGKQFSERLVVRQVRSLEPGMRSLPKTVRDLAIPRDVLQRATRIERVRCTNSGVSDRIEVRTDPTKTPDVGYSKKPLVIAVAGSKTQAAKRTPKKSTPNATTVATRPAGSASVTIDSLGCSHEALYVSPSEYLLGLATQPGAFKLIG
jgi:hypothetical protein